MYGYPEHTKHSVREKLSTDETWIKQALLLLYSYQTEDEKENEATAEQNGKGFNYEDASKLSYYAENIRRGKPLTELQLQEAKNRLPKYAGQILKYIQSNPNHPFTT